MSGVIGGPATSRQCHRSLQTSILIPLAASTSTVVFYWADCAWKQEWGGNCVHAHQSWCANMTQVGLGWGLEGPQNKDKMPLDISFTGPSNQHSVYQLWLLWWTGTEQLTPTWWPRLRGTGLPRIPTLATTCVRVTTLWPAEVAAPSTCTRIDGRHTYLRTTAYGFWQPHMVDDNCAWLMSADFHF